jgi:hypothetical protein
MRRYAVSTLCALMLLGALFIVPTGASAEGTANNAIRVSPVITDVRLKPDQTQASVSAMVTNLTAGPLSIALNSRDFGALNESGTVGFYGNNYHPATNPHSLQNVMSFFPSTVYLAPHGSQTVKITLSNLGSLAAGGHFGAALFTPGSPLATNSGPRVSIRSSLASLIFLVTANGGTENLQLLPFHIGPVSFGLPSLTYIGFHNSGNTQATVRGQITLYGPDNNIVSTAVINPGSGLVLPGTSRVFNISLPLPNTELARPGIYRLKLLYRDDAQTNFMTANYHFYYINLYIFIPVVAIIILVIYLGKWHGRRTLRVGKHAARRSVHVAKKLKRKPPAPVSEPPKKRKPRRVQG